MYVSIEPWMRFSSIVCLARYLNKRKIYHNTPTNKDKQTKHSATGPVGSRQMTKLGLIYHIIIILVERLMATSLLG